MPRQSTAKQDKAGHGAREERFWTLLDGVPCGILAINRDGTIVLVNERVENLFGYPREALVGAAIETLLPERFRQGHVIHRIGYSANPGVRPMGIGRDLAGRRQDGTEFPVEIGLSCVETDSGVLTLAFVTDITERKRAEVAVKDALAAERDAHHQALAVQHRMAFLLEASTFLLESFDYLPQIKQFAQFVVPQMADWCVVHVVERDGSVTLAAAAHVNPARAVWVREYQQRFPLDPNTPHGVYQVLRTGQAEFYPEINDAMLAATASQTEPRWLARELHITAAMIVPLIANERVLGAITLIAAESGRHYTPDDLELALDLGRRAGLKIENVRLFDEAQRLNAELEARVRERTAQLEAANQELEAFSYSVSHDLRAPLRAIDGFSRILLRDHAAQLSPQGQHHLELVRNNTQQMGQLIDDLLTFSRFNRQPLKKEPVALADLVRRVLEDLSSEQEDRHIELTIGELPMCQADPALLKQVFVNLLANALKFTRRREAAQIEVGCRSMDGQPVYFIQDNGVGFDMQYADNLFGVFQRLHQPEDYEGTGVGLAIVQRIIHRHGGRIWAEAAVDQGATFYFTLQGDPSHGG